MVSKYFYILGTLSLFSVILIMASCDSNSSSDRDHLIFRYNEHSNIGTLDPAFASNPQIIWPTNQLFNSLVQLDDSLNIVPDIAKSWTINDSTNTYTFLLRNDVYFHKNIAFGKDSTRKVNAYDFEYSFNRILDDQVASRGRWVFNNVNSFEALNDSIFSIKLNKPFPAFLGLLSMRFCSVV